VTSSQVSRGEEEKGTCRIKLYEEAEELSRIWIKGNVRVESAVGGVRGELGKSKRHKNDRDLSNRYSESRETQ